jgi:hypothetical protein
MVRLRLQLAGIVVALAAACAAPRSDSDFLGPPKAIARGVDLYTSKDATLIDPPGPVSVFLLRLDPAQARLSSALSNDAVVGAERVDAIAQRYGAVAAVNGGFFNVRNGEPVSVLKVSGEIVSDAPAARGVVLIRSPAEGRTELSFDQAAVRQRIHFRAGDRDWIVPIDGVDTTRERGKLMLYTPRYHNDTDTASNGTEWVLEGEPLAVTSIRRDAGRTPIPRAGAVLSYGGLNLPTALAALEPGVPVTIETDWRSLHGRSAADFDAADHIVNGAGLLRLNGRSPANWEDSENLPASSFIAARHPRTLIGVDDDGFIWLIAVDGRQPERSVGMTFEDLTRLCDRLGLSHALNLDGGGSTTMVVKGAIVNAPSDATGPRAVSDAILVTLRGGPGL